MRATGVKPWVLGLVLLTAAGCSEPRYSKPTFWGQGGETPRREDTPNGLNPLGGVEECPAGVRAPKMVNRVLVSKPQSLSRNATQMLLELKDTLKYSQNMNMVDQMLLSPAPILSVEDALKEGKRCGALVVLWERPSGRNLEMTLVESPPLPYRRPIHDHLCPFGSKTERMDILYNIMAGLGRLQQGETKSAGAFFDRAQWVDACCFRFVRRPNREGDTNMEAFCEVPLSPAKPAGRG
ncbi:MAG: hypothetical protein OEV94_00215 [Deltaproteobacteria bacterium]|nr:hypothetical protein [Deltaproteobacteria bacterium]